MIEILYTIDVEIFYFINHTLSNSFFDKLFPFITEVKHWYVAYIILWFTLIFKGGRYGKVAALFAILVITASDQFSSHFLKYQIERIRPCNVLPNVNILVGCTSSYSFPSSHAVNNFAIAIFISRLYPKLKWVLLITAFFMALSRPYVGVHYPSDIIGGAIIGSVIGYIMAIFALKTDKYIQTNPQWMVKLKIINSGKNNN